MSKKYHRSTVEFHNWW